MGICGIPYYWYSFDDSVLRLMASACYTVHTTLLVPDCWPRVPLDGAADTFAPRGKRGTRRRSGESSAARAALQISGA
eukprot:1191600-Pyramimonas_sp.AAC.1